MIDPREYPLPLVDLDHDVRFTFGFVLDVAAVLVKHGYPPVSGLDHFHLGQSLFGFLYTPTNSVAGGAEPVTGEEC